MARWRESNSVTATEFWWETAITDGERLIRVYDRNGEAAELLALLNAYAECEEAARELLDDNSMQNALDLRAALQNLANVKGEGK